VRLRYLLFVLPIIGVSAYADQPGHVQLQQVPVTANPLKLSNDERVKPIHIYSGAELTRIKDSSIGNMLKGTPGVTNAGFGDAIGRPVIRGMDNNRVQMLNNGIQINDVSAMSGDHAIAYDALSAEQIEIVRGPAAVIYGGGATGGVINIIDNRIHTEYYEGLMGAYDLGTGGANNEQAGSFLIDYGIKDIMIHVDGYDRSSKNLKIPGNSVSKELNESEPEEYPRDKYGDGTQTNSYVKSSGGSFGVSKINDEGYTGLSYSNNHMEYGITLEDGAYIDMDVDKYDFKMERKDIATDIDNFKFAFSYSDYYHKEVEPDGAIGTDYIDKQFDGKVEFTHSLFGTPGVIGVDAGQGRFSKDTGAPLIANNQNQDVAIYLLEEFEFKDQTITVGFRQGYTKYDGNSFTSDDGCSNDTCTGDELSTSFDQSDEDFNTTNVSIGSVFNLNSNWSLAVNLNHTQRAPAMNELFTYGEHHATETIEQGDRNLGKEKSNGIDTTLAWQDGDTQLSVSPFYTYFTDYIALIDSGTTQFHDEEGEIEELSVYQYKSVPAEFFGLEFQGNKQLNANYTANIWGDYVRALDKDSGNMPRVPAMRLGSGLDYQWNRLNAGANVIYVFEQDTLAAYELKTGDYTDLSAYVSYALPVEADITLSLSGTNLLDTEQRDSTSIIKDKTLAGSRAVKFGVTGTF
jgi:iron complex outermembrane recepter protein